MTRSVLVVDDDDGIRESLADILVTEGFDVVTAKDGGQALAMLDRIEPPAVIVLDMMMPGMNGWEFLEALPKTKHAGITVVIMSAALDEQLPSGRPTLRKPIHLDGLLEVVSASCG